MTISSPRGGSPNQGMNKNLMVNKWTILDYVINIVKIKTFKYIFLTKESKQYLELDSYLNNINQTFNLIF